MTLKNTQNTAAHMTFTGHLPVASFAEFAQHRATRLSVRIDTIAQDLCKAVFLVEGQKVLVDAFEMAMSLGPQDCLVRDVRRVETTPNRSMTE